jgi:hypothetical protein
MDTHDELMQAYQEYFKWAQKFTYSSSDAAGIKARYWLSEIRRLASDRRTEIQLMRQDRKESKKGKLGRPPNITS